VWCEDAHDFEEQIAKRDHQRREVMREVEASVRSQRAGEFVNNRNKYRPGNVASDGLPIVRVKEPQRLKDYERQPTHQPNNDYLRP
jgi:hypothetical protein